MPPKMFQRPLDAWVLALLAFVFLIGFSALLTPIRGCLFPSEPVLPPPLPLKVCPVCECSCPFPFAAPLTERQATENFNKEYNEWYESVEAKLKIQANQRKRRRDNK